MIKLFDRVKQNISSSGLSNFSFGSVIEGYRSFDSVLSSGDITYYTAENIAAPYQWEIGSGFFDGSQLVRYPVVSSSGVSAINFSGSVFCFITYPATGSVHADGNRHVDNISSVEFNDSTTQVTAYTGCRTALSYQNISSHYSVGDNDEMIFADSTSSGINILLPYASGNGGRQLRIKWVGGDNQVCILATGSDTIDDSVSWCINYRKESLTLISNNQNWHLI